MIFIQWYNYTTMKINNCHIHHEQDSYNAEWRKTDTKEYILYDSFVKKTDETNLMVLEVRTIVTSGEEAVSGGGN